MPLASITLECLRMRVRACGEVQQGGSVGQ